MRKDKRMLKVEARKLENLRNILRSGTKINGTTLILGETNRENLLEACHYIDQAINSLNKIESHA